MNARIRNLAGIAGVVAGIITVTAIVSAAAQPGDTPPQPVVEQQIVEPLEPVIPEPAPAHLEDAPAVEEQPVAELPPASTPEAPATPETPVTEEPAAPPVVEDTAPSNAVIQQPTQDYTPEAVVEAPPIGNSEPPANPAGAAPASPEQPPAGNS